MPSLNVIFFVTQPLHPSLMESAFPSGSLPEWIIIAISTPSKYPRWMNSTFPPKYLMMPCFLKLSRYPSSISSSAGTEMKRMDPQRPSRAWGCFNAAAIPKSAADWALCPQQWVIPFTDSGWFAISRASSSPKIATFGPGFPVSTSV